MLARWTLDFNRHIPARPSFFRESTPYCVQKLRRHANFPFLSQNLQDGPAAQWPKIFFASASGTPAATR
jgi:hypothetical protein